MSLEKTLNKTLESTWNNVLKKKKNIIHIRNKYLEHKTEAIKEQNKMKHNAYRSKRIEAKY